MIMKKPNCFFKKKNGTPIHSAYHHSDPFSCARLYYIPHPSSGFYLFISITRQGLPFYISVRHLAKQNWAFAPAGNCKPYWNTSHDLNFGVQVPYQYAYASPKWTTSLLREQLTWHSFYAETDNSKRSHSRCRSGLSARWETRRDSPTHCQKPRTTAAAVFYAWLHSGLHFGCKSFSVLWPAPKTCLMFSFQFLLPTKTLKQMPYPTWRINPTSGYSHSSQTLAMAQRSVRRLPDQSRLQTGERASCWYHLEPVSIE